MEPWKIIVIICVAILLIDIALFTIVVYAYLKAFHSPKKRRLLALTPKSEKNKELILSMKTSAESLKNEKFEPIYIFSNDKTKLFGRYYHIRDNAPLFIEFHGYKGTAFRDFAGGDMLFKTFGHNTLLVDQRAHGSSGGKSICFGIKERHDCLAWAKYATERFGNIPIFLVGISMGGATVLMASNLELPSNVKGIIADCPYSSPKEIICKVCKKDLRLPPKLIYPFIKIGAIIFGGFNPNKSSAVESVKSTKIPILLIHGKGDTFVPCEMSEKIYQSCTGEKYICTVDGAEHGMAFLYDMSKYEHTIKNFIDNQLSKN
ncbi:MAG: alpha/beta hydrolase [Clostridia bacterium]|nr:alpha/beta hydrolase [Clostridia bacterium]